METQKVVCNKIRAVKNWLTRAEENFNSQNNLQGELNLLLAQAEMKHLKENKKSTVKKRFLTNITVLVVLAICIFYFKEGIFLQQTAKVKKNEQLEQKSAIINKIETPIIQTKTVEKSQNVEVDKSARPTLVEAKNEPVTDKTLPDVVTDQQKHDLVRMAGKVLRSNN